MRFEGTREIQRRAVAWDPGTGVLTVGDRAVTLTCAEGDNDCVLRTYLHLVAEQREIALDQSVVLRQDDILVLAEILDLDDAFLEDRLATILRLDARAARSLRRELLRHRLTAAALGVGLLAGGPLLRGVAAADEPVEVFHRPAAATVEATPVTVVESVVDKAGIVLEAPAPVVAAEAPSEPAPTPPPEPQPETEIGWSVTYERDPDFVPPEGVEIGDAMVLERDAPPPEPDAPEAPTPEG